jgi:hypothetical protein
MKKGVIALAIIFMFSITFVSAACDLEVSMINQDPYPAIPGDYVKVVFQVDGIANDECKNVQFELLEKYPIKFDPDADKIFLLSSGFYEKDYGGAFATVPYKIRIEENALDGPNPIEVKFTYGETGSETAQFDLEIEDARADFEIHIKEYKPSTNTLTFEILNIENSDVEALTIEIPEQKNIIVKNTNRNIVGDLDSNEYTTADFEAIPSKGNIITKLIYTDSTNTRRTIEKTVEFNPEYFQGRISDQKASPIKTFGIWILIIAGIIYYFYRRNKKKKEMAKHKRH